MEELFENEFNTLWKIYPNKQGKMKALQSYVKARKKGTTYEEIAVGMERYLEYCNREKSWYRPKMGSTWFNQNCWLDEIDEGETTENAVDKYGNIIL